MPNELSNFSHPDEGNSSGGESMPKPKQGQHYNPKTGQWETEWAGAGPAPATTIPMGQGGQAAGVSYDPRTGIADFQPGATRGRIVDPYSLGGVSGAVVTGPDGKPMVDPSRNFQHQESGRLRGIADAASRREAYEMDYSKGDADRARTDVTRGNQGVASAMLGDAAKGAAPSGAVIRGQSASDDSFGAALGAQAGAKGGVANQAAATQAGGGVAARNQLGVANKFGGARSDELTGARGAYSQGTNAQRTGDMQQQALDQQRQRAGLANEMSQRELNQGRQLGYEGLGYDTNINAMNAGIKNEQRHAGLTGAAMARETAQADRMASFYNKGIAAVGKLGGSLASGEDEK